jgi:hypothetical protein
MYIWVVILKNINEYIKSIDINIIFPNLGYWKVNYWQYLKEYFTRPSLKEYFTNPSLKEYLSHPSLKEYFTNPSLKEYFTHTHL